MSTAIETHELSKRYRRVSALTGCTVTVPEGRVSALVGPNGAGKTTLLRILAGLASPTGGTASVLDGAPRQDPAFLAEIGFQHVTVVASSGDTGAISHNGPPRQVSVPASDPLALAAGGTTLDAASPAGTYLGEMAWNDGDDASGGGYSSLFSRPAYQDGVARGGATRGVPDVAANADSSTAMALEYSDGEFRPASGTSASAPLWAGVIALADQQAGQHLGFVNPAIYAIARSRAYHQAFHDVITGDNSVLWPTGVFVGYNGGPGWDPVTGWGSPDAQYLVPLLTRARGVPADRQGHDHALTRRPPAPAAR
jgi:subtilase family serine protease